MTFERVAIVFHEDKPRAVELERELREWVTRRGVEVTNEDPDLVVSLGGDGTMLRAAQLAHATDAPLVGVNLGALGYLTEVDAGEEKEALEKILAGSYEIEERMMLRCTATDGDDVSFVGLNEVLVERSGAHRLVRLEVHIGGERLAAFNADGVLVATPTGSTAYALSAGGPIVSPRAQSLVLVPVSAHMIFSRPFVLAADETVSITVGGRGQQASLVLDGTIGCDIGSGATVTVCRHERPLPLLKVAGPGFLARLRVKLDLPG